MTVKTSFAFKSWRKGELAGCCRGARGSCSSGGPRAGSPNRRYDLATADVPLKRRVAPYRGIIAASALVAGVGARVLPPVTAPGKGRACAECTAGRTAAHMEASRGLGMYQAGVLFSFRRRRTLQGETRLAMTTTLRQLHLLPWLVSAETVRNPIYNARRNPSAHQLTVALLLLDWLPEIARDGPTECLEQQLEADFRDGSVEPALPRERSSAFVPE